MFHESIILPIRNHSPSKDNSVISEAQEIVETMSSDDTSESLSISSIDYDSTSSSSSDDSILLPSAFASKNTNDQDYSDDSNSEDLNQKGMIHYICFCSKEHKRGVFCIQYNSCNHWWNTTRSCIGARKADDMEEID